MDTALAAIAALAPYLRTWGPNKAAREVARNVCEQVDRELDAHCRAQRTEFYSLLLAQYPCNESRELIDRLRARHCALGMAWKTLRRALHDVSLCLRSNLPQDDVDRFVRAYRLSSDSALGIGTHGFNRARWQLDVDRQAAARTSARPDLPTVHRHGP